MVVDEPHSLQRCDLEPVLRRRAAATAATTNATAPAANAPPTAAAATEEPEVLRERQYAEKHGESLGKKKKQQRREDLEMDFLHQEISAGVAAMQMLVRGTAQAAFLSVLSQAPAPVTLFAISGTQTLHSMVCGADY